MLQSLVVKPRNLGFRGLGARLTQVKDLGCIGAQVGHLGFLPVALGICQALPARGRGRIGHRFAGQEVLHSISCMLKVLPFEGDKASAGRFPSQAFTRRIPDMHGARRQDQTHAQPGASWKHHLGQQENGRRC